MVTLQWASVEHGKKCRAVEGRVGFTHSDARRNRRAGALKRANHALPSPPSSLLSTCSIRVHSWFYYSPVSCITWFISTSGDARRNRRAGAPKRANHALPSPPSSLLSTLEAHCKVTTHYLLLPPPYSLLNHNYGFVVGFRVDIEGCDLSVLPCCIHRETSPCPEAVELSILPGLWECRQQMYDTCV